MNSPGEPLRIVFRTEGGHKTGLGHIMRCLRLADELSKHFLLKITFLLSPSDLSTDKLFENRPYEIMTFKVGGEKGLLEKIHQHSPPGLWISDLRSLREKSLYQYYAERYNYYHIAIDDMHLCGAEADITINPSIVPCGPSSHPFSKGKYYCGPEYFFYFPNKDESVSSSENRKRVLISMGGSDINQMTGKFLHSLGKLGLEAEIHAVIGPAFQGDIADKLIPGKGNIFLHHSPKSLDTLISQSCLVITSGGLTLYESVRWGVPVLAIPQTSFELPTAKAFEERGAAINMGTGNLVDPALVGATAMALLGDKKRLREMALACKGIFIGQGVKMVKEIMTKSLTNKPI